MANSFSSMLDLVYPTGAYYLSRSSTNPGTLFGGTWAAITDPKFLKIGNSNNTGGSLLHQHLLTSTTGWALAEVGCSNNDIANISYWADTAAYNIRPGSDMYNTYCTNLHAPLNETFSPHQTVTKYTVLAYQSGYYTSNTRTWVHNVPVYGWTGVSNNEPQYQMCYTWYRTS